MASPKSPTNRRAFWAILLCTALLAPLSAPAGAQEEPSPAPLVPTSPTSPTSSIPSTAPRDELQQPDAAPETDPCLVDPQCEQLYEQARTAFKEARYEDAFNAYQEAYKRRQVPWLQLNSGRALQRLGRLDEALSYYDRYKRADVKPTPERLAKANQYIAEVKAALEEAAQRRPVVTAAPPPPTPAPAPEARPVYKKWWFWTILGGVVVAGAVATGLALGLPRSSTPPVIVMQPQIPAGVSVYQPMF